MKAKTTYMCEICEEEFPTPQEANACNAACDAIVESNKQIAEFQKLFPARHPKDDKWQSHCVNCGKVLVSFSKAFDGHRYEQGEEDQREQVYHLLGGRYCQKCYVPVNKRVMEVLIEHFI